MYWQAPMVDRWIGDDLLRAAFAAAFNLDEASILVTHDTATLVGQTLRKPYILLERVGRDGPFPLQLNVFLVGTVIEQPVASLPGTLRYAGELARRLGAVLLLGDGPIGHEEQLRVSPDGTVDIVELDGDEMDEERYMIVGARPFTEHPAEPAPARTG